MSNISLQLYLPTNRTIDGPIFIKKGDQVIVEYDYEQDDGKMKWAKVVFSEVLIFRYGQSACCSVDDFVNKDVIICLTESETLARALNLWQENVGWQDWQKMQGSAARFKEFKMYFDDSGCLDVIASSCQILAIV